MPHKPLPANPNLQHLKFQARDLLKEQRLGDRQTLQRIREFHPRFAGASDQDIAHQSFALSDAQLTIAREHSYSNWSQLKAGIEAGTAGSSHLPYGERIPDHDFKHAVRLVDAGDENGLRTLLITRPSLALQRVFFNVSSYFGNPSLLEFVAENPIRHGSLPPNICAVAAIIVDAGAGRDGKILDGALGLVASGRVPRECSVQIPLIEMLCGAGANPETAMSVALVHGEFDAVRALLKQGARVDLVVAAALGHTALIPEQLLHSTESQQQLALAFAAQFGRTEAARMLMQSGVDPNRYNPKGAHSHSTPLHQAALYGHEDVVRLLLQYGADPTLRDAIYQGTAAGWAAHGGHQELAALLSRLGVDDASDRREPG